jgi:hypothetical protein
MNPTSFDTTVEMPLQAPTHPSVVRAVLLMVCVVAALGGLAVGHPERLLQTDPELARLLRGMALIKAGILVAALGLLSWRFHWRTSKRLVVVYNGAAAAMSFAAGLIWQLTSILVAAGLFHLGLVVLLVAMLRDNTGRSGIPRRRPRKARTANSATRVSPGRSRRG